ncbi:MAG: HAD family hydrolase [Lachnospiraceae bacterium]|nr:HAD family hydrolase [Lachnospiraceae bacterium]
MSDHRYDGIIFDVDGTLWDSTYVVEKAWNKALHDSGYSNRITADTLKGLFGLPMLEIIENIIPESAMEEREAFLKVCSGYEFEFLEAEAGVVYPGLEDTLKELSTDHPLFIVSNCQQGYIDLFSRKTGLGHYFTEGICPGDTDKLKADNIRIIIDRYGLKNPVYVGDTDMDHVACIKAKVPFCFAAYGFGDTKAPDHIIDKVPDLIKVCNG